VRAGSRMNPPAEITAAPLRQPAHRSLKTQQRTGRSPQQSEEISVGDEVDIHLGELWHRTIRFTGVNEAHGSSTNTAPIRPEPDSLERR